MEVDRVHGEVLDHVLDLRVLPQLSVSVPFPMKISVEGHHSHSEDHEVVQLVERREVNRVLSSRAREFLVEPEPRGSCSAGQARLEGDVQSVSVCALQFQHGVIEALRSGQVVRDGQADGRVSLALQRSLHRREFSPQQYSLRSRLVRCLLAPPLRIGGATIGISCARGWP